MQCCHVIYILAVIVTVKSNETTRLENLIESFWQWRLYEWPEFGTKFGFHEHNTRIENYTEAAFRNETDSAERFLREASSIDQYGLSSQEEISLSVLKDLLTTFIDGYQYRKYSIYNYLAPLDNVKYRLDRMVSMMPKKTEQDFQNILSRYRQVPQQLRDMETLMRMAVEAKTTAHVTSVNATIEDLDNVKTDTFLSPFAEENMPEEIVEPMRSSLRSQADDLVTPIIQGLESYREYLANEYFPNARQIAGVGSLPDGVDYYKACLKWHTSVDMPPDEVHRLGLEQVERISSKMADIIRRSGFSGTVKEYINHLSQDPDNFYETSEEMLEGYKEIVARAHEKLHTILFEDNIPDNPVVVQPSPQAVSRYSEPAVDGSTPGIFFADVSNPEEKPKYNMVALTLHEAEPGHHTQTIYSFYKGLPEFRTYVEYLRYNAVPFNWLFHTAYSEGWALYTESLGEEMEIYQNDLELFGRYASEIHRATRLVVDTGIHVYGWTIEQAEEYMLNYTALGAISVHNEVIRYVSWPGQACSYKIGEIKIRQLRDYSEEKLGDKFNLKEFHHEILSFGSVPLSILDDHIKNWVSDKLDPGTTDGASLIQQSCTMSIIWAVVLIYYIF